MMPRFRHQLASLLSSSCSTDLNRNYSFFQFFAYGQRSEARACIELQNVRGFDGHEVSDAILSGIEITTFIDLNYHYAIDWITVSRAGIVMLRQVTLLLSRKLRRLSDR